jgi:hypothetical protein
MRLFGLRQWAAIAGLIGLCVGSIPAHAQTSNAKPADQKAAAEAAAKESQQKIDEIAEAGRLMRGPASNPECVWLGRRIVSLMWRDDLDTAFRHLDLYDRFGCPSGHIQTTFRCIVRQGNIDPKARESLNGRVHACWIDPGLKAALPTAGPAAAQAAPPAQAPAAAASATAR